MAEDAFDLIKEQNGEGFAKGIRAHDNGIFDVPGIVEIVKYAGRDIKALLPYLESLKDIKIPEKEDIPSPFELLDKAGYKAEYADTLEKQNSIAKYFKEGERLCTFNDSSRYQDYYIVNAVRRGVENIRRFENPERGDAYGTSVISIQMAKGGGAIKITNRYNHTVINPDNTFSSNPDNIIDGLSASLKKHFNVNFASQKVSLPEGYKRVGDRILKYNMESNNVYFGKDFYTNTTRTLMHGYRTVEVHEIDKHNEIMMDCFIFNAKTKEIHNPAGINDPFIEAFQDEIKGKKVKVSKDAEGNKCISADGVTLVKVKDGHMVHVCLPSLVHADDHFLKWNQKIKHLELPKLQSAGSNFLGSNSELMSLSLPQLELVQDEFLSFNGCLENVHLPKLKSAGMAFLQINRELKQLSLPQLEATGEYFISGNENIEKLYLPRLKVAGTNFLADNKKLTSLDLPCLTSAKAHFIYANKSIKYANLPQLGYAGTNFLYGNNALTELYLPKLKEVDDYFLHDNKTLRKFCAPLLREKGCSFLNSNILMEAQHILQPRFVSEWVGRNIEAQRAQDGRQAVLVG